MQTKEQGQELVDEANENLMSWACAVLSEDKFRANNEWVKVHDIMERFGTEPSFGFKHNGVTLPSRKQFFAYDLTTGQIR